MIILGLCPYPDLWSSIHFWLENLICSLLVAKTHITGSLLYITSKPFAIGLNGEKKIWSEMLKALLYLVPSGELTDRNSASLYLCEEKIKECNVLENLYFTSLFGWCVFFLNFDILKVIYHTIFTSFQITNTLDNQYK